MEQDGSRDALELRQALLQLQVQGERAGDGAHRGRPGAEFRERLLPGFHQAGMVGEPEVIIGAEVQHLPAIHHQGGALRGADGADAVIQPGFLKLGELFFDPVQSVGHGNISGEEGIFRLS